MSDHRTHEQPEDTVRVTFAELKLLRAQLAHANELHEAELSAVRGELAEREAIVVGLSGRCDQLERDREYNAQLVRERDVEIESLRAAPGVGVLEEIARELAEMSQGQTHSLMPTEFYTGYIDGSNASYRHAAQIVCSHIAQLQARTWTEWKRRTVATGGI